VKRFADTKVRTFPADEEVPLDGVVRSLWLDAVVEKDSAGRDRINRVTYEVAVLETLREQLRCKEIWVVVANRYRNPDEDLPADFEANRDEYYKALNLPLDADRFITELQDEMREALGTLDGGLKKNPYVRIGPKGGGRITLTPLDAQPDPPNLTAFKAELNATWPMTSLLDMVKETDLRLGFTDMLKSPTAYEMLERSVLQPRLLLCLHGIGTNAGLQRMAGLESGVTAKDLSYVRRRYISVDALRRAIAIVADGTLKARNPAALHQEELAAPNLQSLCRTGQGHQDNLPLLVSAFGSVAPRDPRRAERGRTMERCHGFRVLCPSRRDGQQPPGRPRDQHARAAPDSELHGLRQHVDDSESTGAAALAREVDTPRLRRADPADLGAREPVWSV
jgi:Tn3 transposase DDE domain